MTQLILLNALKVLKTGEMIAKPREEQKLIKSQKNKNYIDISKPILNGCENVHWVWDTLLDFECIEPVYTTKDGTVEYYGISDRGQEVYQEGIRWYNSLSFIEKMRLYLNTIL